MRSIVLLLVLGGCTAAKATIQIVSAEQALRRADEYDCRRTAAYEYVMAEQYLEKAREEAGYSEFRIADALARQSAEWSDRAIIFVERRGQDVNLDDFTESAAPAPVPAPTTEPSPIDQELQELIGPQPSAPEPEREPELELDDDE